LAVGSDKAQFTETGKTNAGKTPPQSGYSSSYVHKWPEKNFGVNSAIPLEPASLLGKSLYGCVQRMKNLAARRAASGFWLLAISEAQNQAKKTAKKSSKFLD